MGGGGVFFSRLEDAATDGHVAGEGALLVDVVAFLRELGRLEPKADILHETHALVLRGEKKTRTVVTPPGFGRVEAGTGGRRRHMPM